MQRDLRRLADTRFDVVVVGAGFYGVTAAWDAAQRGLSVAIIDKDDFGAATSFNNLKTLHGGLRSLQALNFTQMRLFIRERRALARIAAAPGAAAAVRRPDHAQPEAKCAGDADRARDQRRRGAAIATRACPIRARTCRESRIVSRDEALRLNPVVVARGRHRRRGLVRLPDAEHRSRDAVVPAVGGRCRRVAANYVQATRFLQQDGRVTGVHVEDRLTNEAVRRSAAPWS